MVAFEGVCPACGVTRYSKHWSNCQKNAQSPRAIDADGRARNCCKQCSDVAGWYYTSRVSNLSVGLAPGVNPDPPYRNKASPPRPSSSPSMSPSGSASKRRSSTKRKQEDDALPDLEQVLQELDAARTWLRKNIASKFWDRAHEWMVEMNYKHREDIHRYNERNGHSRSKSLLKNLSHAGAIRLPDWAPEKWTCYECPVTKTNYLDVRNKNYNEVMQTCWPHAMQELGITNDETAGDLVEATLGYYYFLTVKRCIELDVVVLDFVIMLERASMSTYLKNEHSEK